MVASNLPEKYNFGIILKVMQMQLMEQNCVNKQTMYRWKIKLLIFSVLFFCGTQTRRLPVFKKMDFILFMKETKQKSDKNKKFREHFGSISHNENDAVCCYYYSYA